MVGEHLIDVKRHFARVQFCICRAVFASRLPHMTLLTHYWEAGPNGISAGGLRTTQTAFESWMDNPAFPAVCNTRVSKCFLDRPQRLAKILKRFNLGTLSLIHSISLRLRFAMNKKLHLTHADRATRRLDGYLPPVYTW